SLVDTIDDLKMDTVGITEHGNLFSMLPFYKAARAAGVKPILGCEIYVAKGSLTDKQSTRQSGWGNNHLVLLAKNATGLHNLIKLVSIGYLDGFYYRPRVDKDLLRQYSEGLICTSACLKGEVQQAGVSSGLEGAKAVALEYAEIFPGNFYLELQRHQIPEEDIACEINIRLARELDLPLVATNDCHYARQEHWEAHDIMFCLGTGKDRDDPDRQRYATPEFYFKTADQMYELFSDVPVALENTLAIAEQCDVEIELGKLHLPNFPIPADSGTSDPDEYLRQVTERGLKSRYAVTPEVRQRLDHELGVIRKMGYAGYFLIVMDFIRYAHSKQIPVGPGRGSAAGSLVAYSLGITDVDPLQYNLLFERFLNPERVSMPDIDIDFCQERRGEVIDYVKELYGEEAVCQIITFGKLKAKSVVRDVARVLGMSYGEADRIAKLIPDGPKVTIEKAMAENPELVKAESVDDRHRELFQFSRVLEGMNRHASTHAAGVVIAPGELTDYVPLYKHAKTGDITTQVDMGGLEEMGLLKMDFLGLRTLTVIDHTAKMVRAKGIAIDIEKLPLDDAAAYELFAKGQTIGIFQFESSGMREFLTKLKPTILEDLIAMNALYRPGPMAFIDDFIDRKHGRKHITYLHKSLEPLLKETYGIIVYQEQVMQIANVVAGFSLADADLMRRAMGKKKAREMERLEGVFIDGAVKNDIPREIAKEIYDLIARFAEYGFNKSHSTAYALVAYQTAYLKAHHPAEFMAANLSSEMSNTTRMTTLLAEARDMGLEVLPPDVNYSSHNFRVESEGHIRFGLNAIKHVGQKAAEHIREQRQASDEWRTLADFLAAVDPQIVNRKAVECLIRSGACDSLEGSRSQKFAMLEDTLKYAQGIQAGLASQQENLFGGGNDAVTAPPALPQVPPWSDEARLEAEKELIGYYLTGHPLQAFQDDLREFSNYNNLDPTAALKLEQLKVGGIIGQLKNHHTRKGLPMAFFTLEGQTTSIEVVVFSDLYTKVQQYLVEDAKVFVLGKPTSGGAPGSSPSNGDEESSVVEIKILAEDILPLEDIRKRLAKKINVRLNLPNLEGDLIKRLHSLAYANRGPCEFWLHVIDDPDDTSQVHRIRSADLKASATPVFLEQLRELVGPQNVWISTR
ncbi:MAG: DNA polymerase III subunit alpha, partial [Candidatus Marinimicrobia bacterium]|nr:DNA polymerase III subunit alpha [Candidatus Neomarinimicrobiota bacterium]